MKKQAERQSPWFKPGAFIIPSSSPRDDEDDGSDDFFVISFYEPSPRPSPLEREREHF